MKILTFLKQKTLSALLGCFFCLSLLSCSSSQKDLNLDSPTWKADVQGCKGDRLKLKEQAEDIRLKLIGLHERDIRKILGKPDAQELLSSSQEIYIYYLAGSPKCPNAAVETSVKEALTVRMDALGNVREATMLRD